MLIKKKIINPLVNYLNYYAIRMNFRIFFMRLSKRHFLLNSLGELGDSGVFVSVKGLLN